MALRTASHCNCRKANRSLLRDQERLEGKKAMKSDKTFPANAPKPPPFEPPPAQSVLPIEYLRSLNAKLTVRKANNRSRWPWIVFALLVLSFTPLFWILRLFVSNSPIGVIASVVAGDNSVPVLKSAKLNRWGVSMFYTVHVELHNTTASPISVVGATLAFRDPSRSIPAVSLHEEYVKIPEGIEPGEVKTVKFVFETDPINMPQIIGHPEKYEAFVRVDSTLLDSSFSGTDFVKCSRVVKPDDVDYARSLFR
jgi:hypothetical protein